MKIDQSGIDFIKELEGFRSKPYQDRAGVWTIGFGHTHEVTEHTPEIDIKQGEDFLWDDIGLAEKTIRDHVEIELTQNEYNALCAFIFNIGGFAFAMSTLLRKLNRGDKMGASKEFLRWDFRMDTREQKKLEDPGLLERRKKEQALFLKDISTTRSLLG